MFKGLHLKNFKSWREADVSLAPITGFFGANSSGKSSLLQALLLMKQTAESSDQQQILELGGNESLVELGSVQEMIFQNRKDELKENELLGLGISWRLGKKFEIVTTNLSTINICELNFTAKILVNKNSVHVEDFSYVSENLSTPVIASKSMRIAKFYKVVQYTHEMFEKNEPSFGQFSFAFEELFQSTYYLAPLRDPPKRTYLWSGAAPSNVGKSGENTIAALLAARANNMQVNNKPLEVVISEKLEQLGLIHSFRLEELREGTNIFRVLLRRTPESPEVSLTDVGFGVSQLLPVLVLLYYVPEGSTVILEQPELHLHPSVQAGLADIFIDAWQTRGIQILLESHSEHLLQRLQRRVAEEKIPNTDMALYFCSLEQGESKLTTLELDEYGAIRNYPKDFFGDQFGEIASASTAALERKIAAQKDHIPA
jgi:predicted ATPase